MMDVSNIWFLLKKEARLEWRERSTFAGMILYALGATFIVYFAFKGEISFDVWAANFWIIALFTIIHAISKSFVKEANEQFYYIRNVVKPSELLISKVIYNALLIFVFELLIFFEMTLFFGIEVQKTYIFFAALFLGGMSLSNMFTLFSVITAKTGNIVLLAVLGFPLILPVLLLVLRLTGILDNEILEKDISVNLGSIALLNIITLLLSWILFPFLWKD